MTWDGVERRGDSVMPGGTLQAKLDALNDNVKRLTEVVDENTKALSRLAVLETDHKNSNMAIERAFKSIEKAQKEFDDHVKRNEENHGRYNQWIYTVAGFAAAVSVFWTVAGYRLNAIIDDTSKAVTEMRMHIHDDKITNADQVRSVK